MKYSHYRYMVLVALSWSMSVAAVAAGEEAAAKKNAGRPNIILIMADDIGYECFGCYGSQQYQTPNIDRMAQRGMRFTQCYSQPLCTPTRVKLMTGKSNVRNYAAFSVLNPDERTIGQYFQQAGYETAIAGKWQLLGAENYAEKYREKGIWPEAAGFDHHCLWQVDKLGSRYWEPLLRVDGKNQQFGEDEFGPEICTKYLTDFMAQRTEGDKPFFIYYPMILVHDPFVPTPDSKSRQGKDRQQNFEDMVAYMDKLVGRIVAKTEELGIAEETLIMFTGDNGTHPSISSRLGDRVIRGGKGSTTDAGMREPLVAYWPGVVSQGQVTDTLVDCSDFLPTLLTAAGADVPTGLDGHSFYPQLCGKTGTPREWMFCYYCPRPERTRPVRFARDQRYKLYGDGRFFDVANDSLEKHPLGNTDGNAEAEAARKKLAAAMASMPAEGQSLLKFTRDKE